MKDERGSGDDEPTNPDIGREEPTNPGTGAGEAFNRACGDLERAVRSVSALAKAYPGVRKAGLRRFWWEMALKAGEGGEIFFELRRAALMQMRIEEGEER